MKKYFLFFFLVTLILGSCASRRTVLKPPGNITSNSKTGNRTSSAGSQGTTLSGHDYIERYRDIAIAEMNTYGIPASIKLAQALLESGNGNSYLAREANNHFGIKCGGVWKGRSVVRSDDNPNDCFRVYSSPEQSFRDHSEFLLRKRYEKLFRLSKNDYKGWARGLKEAGYATNPRYPQLLIDLIERYELYRYDKPEASYLAKEIRTDKVEEAIVLKETVIQKEEVKIEDVKSPVAMVIYEVRSSDTLYSISREFNITVDELKQMNGITSDIISIGQLLLITK